MHRLSGIAGIFALLTVNSAYGQSALINPETIAGWVDLRAAYSDAGREWLDGGLSKTRYGAVSGDGVDGEVAEAALVWTPSFSFSVSGHLHLQAGPDQETPLSTVEAFAIFRAPPAGRVRLSGRAGRFYPPISLEHDGPGWSLTRTITPSAINSWIGEEVAVIGAEAKARRAFGDHLLEARGAVFGFNDTAGALIAFRGWALHDIKSVIGGGFQIPDNYARRAAAPLQAERTRPTKELDDRAGAYGAIRWRYSDLFAVSGLAYDNRADPEALTNGQYGWATRFVSAGIALWPGSTFEVLAQGMFGESTMGGIHEPVAGARLYDLEFSSAYVLASVRRNANVFSARLDGFRVLDRNSATYDRGEAGWSVTTAWLHDLTNRLQTGVELIYVENGRNVNMHADARPDATQLQGALRLRF